MNSRKGRQLSFNKKGFIKPKDCFGGSLLKSHPKCKRPLDSKLPIHIVLRATRSGMRRPKAFRTIAQIITQTARKNNIAIYKMANVGNHIHLLVRVKVLRKWSAFIRELSGRIAALMRGILGLKKGETFWIFRPFTRIVRGWQKAFQIVKEYVQLNILEAEGCISRKQIKSLEELKLIFSG